VVGLKERRHHLDSKTAFSAAQGTAPEFGIPAGLGGLTQVVGEVLQGHAKPDGIIISSWTQGRIATNMGGEPGMTVVPNLLVTGILTILASLAVRVCTASVRNKKGGRILLPFSIIMLLAGGGFGPPIIGVLAGVAGTGIGMPSIWWRERRLVKVRRFLGKVWAWIFGLAVMNGVFLVIESVILVYVVDLNNPHLFTNSLFFAVLSLSVTVFVGRACDLQETEPGIVARAWSHLAGIARFGLPEHSMPGRVPGG
jgi:hypothetical protein